MGGSPSTQTVYESFEDIKTKFEFELTQRSRDFEQRVYDITLGKHADDIKVDATKEISTEDIISKSAVTPEQLDKANAEGKTYPAPNPKPPSDANGEPIDLKATPAPNTLIVLYNDQTVIVDQSSSSDFGGLKESINKITNAIAQTFPTGPAAAGGAEGMLASLATNPQKIADGINAVVSGVLGMCSTSSNVSLNSHSSIQYVPPGIYVACLTFSSTVSAKNWDGLSNNVMMWLVKTIVCTSTSLLNAGVVRQEVLEKLQTNRIARLNVVAALGTVIGIADSSDLGTTIFLPADGSTLQSDIQDVLKAQVEAPTGPEPTLSSLDNAQTFSSAVQYYDQMGKALGWLAVVKMYKALGNLAANKGIDDPMFDKRSTAYQASITRLGTKTKAHYDALNNELIAEENHLLSLLQTV